MQVDQVGQAGVVLTPLEQVDQEIRLVLRLVKAMPVERGQDLHLTLAVVAVELVQQDPMVIVPPVAEPAELVYNLVLVEQQLTMPVEAEDQEIHQVQLDPAV